MFLMIAIMTAFLLQLFYEFPLFHFLLHRFREAGYLDVGVLVDSHAVAPVYMYLPVVVLQIKTRIQGLVLRLQCMTGFQFPYLSFELRDPITPVKPQGEQKEDQENADTIDDLTHDDRSFFCVVSAFFLFFIHLL